MIQLENRQNNFILKKTLYFFYIATYILKKKAYFHGVMSLLFCHMWGRILDLFLLYTCLYGMGPTMGNTHHVTNSPNENSPFSGSIDLDHGQAGLNMATFLYFL